MSANLVPPLENAIQSPRALRAAEIGAAICLTYLIFVLAAAAVELLDPNLDTTYVWPAVLALMALPFGAFLVLARSGRTRSAALLGGGWGVVSGAIALGNVPFISVHTELTASGALFVPVGFVGLVAIAGAAASAMAWRSSTRRPDDHRTIVLTSAGCLVCLASVMWLAAQRDYLYPRSSPNLRGEAIGRLRSIASAEAVFVAINKRYGTLDDLIQAGTLDAEFVKAAPLWRLSVVLSPDDFTATVTPVFKSYGYYITSDGVSEAVNRRG